MRSLSLAVQPAFDLNAQMPSPTTRSAPRSKGTAHLASVTPSASAPAAAASMVLQRERLYGVLDARLPGAVWLHGPTGAGKTMLLRSYLQRVGGPVLWLTADERHNDPAALFGALTRLAEASGARQLPVFSPEHRDGADAFAARYFERLDASLDAASAVVIDDAHWLAGFTANLLGCAIDAFGGRRTLCFASQLLPDSAFAPHIAGSRLWIVGHKMLAFDTTEARQLAAQLGTVATALDDLVGATDGWAAGLMLAMQLAAASGSSSTSADALAQVRTPLAQLIAGQVLGGVVREDLARLRLLAELPQVPIALAEQNPAWAAACAQLQRLAERGLFVERLASDRDERDTAERHHSPAAHGCWRLHDLLRSALREPGAIGMPAPEVGESLVDMLLAIDRLDLAWQLAARLGPESLDRVVALHGSIALRSPEHTTYRRVAAPLATEYAPRIALWQARALLGDDDDGALDACEAAYRGSVRQNEVAMTRQAVALALLACFDRREDLSALSTWRERFEATEKADAARPDPAPNPSTNPIANPIVLAARLLNDHVFGVSASSPEESAKRQDALLTAIIEAGLTPNENVLAATALVATLQRTRRFDDAAVAIALVEASDSFLHAAIHVRTAWSYACGYIFITCGLPDRARAAFTALLALAESNALPFSRVDALIGLVRLDLSERKMTDAKRRLDEAESAGKTGKLIQQGWILHSKSRFAMTAGRTAEALQFLDAAERVWIEDGFPKASLTIIDVDRVQLLFALNRVAEALAIADGMAASGNPGGNANFFVMACLLRSLAVWDEDRVEAERQLQAGVHRAAEVKFGNFLLLLHAEAGLVAHRALEAGIEVEFVRRAIRSRCLPSPAGADSRWPWALRIELLGAFRLIHDDAPIVFTGKAQQKPLELLKFLGAERGMAADTSAIAAALWPDSDGAAAKKSVEVTVSRLRKLLGDDALVQVAEGRVRLDPSQVWCDAQALWALCLGAETMQQTARPAIDVIDLGERLLRAYSGDLLPNEDEGMWRVGARDRYRNAFVRAVRTLANYWNDRDDVARAIPLLEAAITRDPLAEALYQVLIGAYVKENQPAEAMRVYRQCRQMLSVLIGASPSPQTEKLRMSIDLQPGSVK